MPQVLISGLYISGALRLATGYGKMLTDGISESQFFQVPHPSMNHPGFCYGHLAIYPDQALEILGQTHLCKPREEFAVFKAGEPSIADASRYPRMAVITEYYLERYDALANALDAIDESILAGPNPMKGRLREMCPTVGAAVNFYANGHHMVHLGQVSAWRRAIGLPGVM